MSHREASQQSWYGVRWGKAKLDEVRQDEVN